MKALCTITLKTMRHREVDLWDDKHPGWDSALDTLAPLLPILEPAAGEQHRVDFLCEAREKFWYL